MRAAKKVAMNGGRLIDLKRRDKSINRAKGNCRMDYPASLGGGEAGRHNSVRSMKR